MMDMMLQVITATLIILNGVVLHHVNTFFECSNCTLGRKISKVDRVFIVSIWTMTVFLVVLLIGWIFPKMAIITDCTTIFVLEFNYILYLTMCILYLRSHNNKLRICRPRNNTSSQPIVTNILK